MEDPNENTQQIRDFGWIFCLVVIMVSLIALILFFELRKQQKDANNSFYKSETTEESLSQSATSEEVRLKNYLSLQDTIHIVEILTIGENPDSLSRRSDDVTVRLSPNENFIFITRGIGDGVTGWVYDVKEKTPHQIDVSVSTVKPAVWLEDGGLELYSGCVSAEYCKHYISESTETPWLLREI